MAAGITELQTLKQAGFFGAHSFRFAANSDTGSSKETPWRRSVRRGITARKMAAGIIMDMPVPLALRAGQPVRRGEGRILPGRDPHPHAAGTRPASHTIATAEDAAYATFELEGGVGGALQLILVRARAPRRSADHSGGGHQG